MPSGNPPQRTAEDRERARAERERRRQANGKQPQASASRSEMALPENADAPAVPSGAGLPDEIDALAVPGGAGLPKDADHPAAPVDALERLLVPEPVLAPQPVLATGTAEIEIPAPMPRRLASPEPAPLPPRIMPPQAVGHTVYSSPRRWPARLGVGVGLVLVLAALGAAVAVVLHNRSHKAQTPPPVPVVRVTIPEGETRVQIAQIAAAKGLRGSYLKASRRSGLLNPAHFGAPHDTHSLEGFLFPATYELFAGASTRHLVELQLAAFHENFSPAQVRQARALRITPYELLIVASMVEREALLARDRPRVAAVIYNRLRLGMPLGIDSTIRYALHDYAKPLTEAQLQIDSPYNTRTHRGLPPTPISNPGLAAIDAAARPAHAPYLYYVNGADGCGELVFSTSNTQFERDASAYREAIARNGGRVPSCRKH
jgi:cell division protein YceG involved in septum cleavage